MQLYLMKLWFYANILKDYPHTSTAKLIFPFIKCYYLNVIINVSVLKKRKNDETEILNQNDFFKKSSCYVIT
jgi:hypothetical protein